MARTLDDLLARRTRTLFIDAGQALAQAPQAADLLTAELHRNAAWRTEELRRFAELARAYMPL
ncbi:MAG: glycerol-3-phosphate dehydrogenase C-terminal domain-containing protein [Candidatus Baltobacteraceae bacterium]